MAERPTPSDVRKARKAQLVAWCEELGLNAEGKVDELRERLIAHLETPEKKPEAEAPEAAEEEEEEAAEEAEKGEAAYQPKLKPKLDPSLQKALRMRRSIAQRRPAFKRQMWFRYQRLGSKWRRARGMHSKLKRHFGYRPNVASIGYRGPREARGLHPSGFREVLVHSVRELDPIDPKVEAARIGGTVGTRKRLEIQAVADEKGIRVLNRRKEE